MHFPFLDHLIQELTNRLVTNENRFYVQYLIPKKLSGLTRELTEKLYETFSDDLIAKDVSEFRQEIFGLLNGILPQIQNRLIYRKHFNSSNKL